MGKMRILIPGTMRAARGSVAVSMAIAIFGAPRRVIAIGFIWRTECLAVQMWPFGRLRTMSLPAGAVFCKYCQTWRARLKSGWQ
jgi:hypothetical protein